MKISDVKVYLCEGHTNRLRWVFVHVETDTGIIGLSDATNWPHGEVIARTIESFKDVVIGESPLDIEKLYNKMYWSLIPFGPGGVMISAIVGIETACWDIIGQVTNQPSYNLIGGRVREKIRLFGIGRAPRFRTSALPDSRVGDESGLWSRLPPLDCEEEVENASWTVEQGFTAVKYAPKLREVTRTHIRDARRIGLAIRDTVGPDVDISVDAPWAQEIMDPPLRVENGYSIPTRPPRNRGRTGYASP